ncbi:glutaminyl-tRNA synthetase [Candidatus Moduliflexus flocculans]|uniref:Glutamine--tRNA ligase n=1 Tax=Candidatus Moduliflexus flocculans TaxID=1499966 RepID=A0A081BLX9_9BACT|nr:glutaminyl-tRNA synthetase [Candidatus Moduliflexus flocculans]
MSDINTTTNPTTANSAEEAGSLDFIRTIVEEDIRAGKHKEIVTRFPPEPNGYLHIGHAKAICTDFGVAKEYGGRCHLRFDDTNPTKEDVEYVDSIQEDVHWLGFDWGKHLYYASDYFPKLYEYAIMLIKEGKAYVDDSTAEEIRVMRGTLTEPGKESPYRNRSVEENLDLFERMKNGEFEDGSRVLRAKIDMASPNMVMRDPTLYRIRHFSHHRTGDAWCIYPMYDYTHCLSDMIEGVTHSICTLEFENNRELYDWVLDNLPVPCHPHQYEFARLNLTYTMMSKRKLLQLVQENLVSGWDDPRMPTLSGLRRRGYTPESIRNFCDRIGLAKRNSMVDVAMLEFSIREELNRTAQRVMAVLNPLKVVIENYPDDLVEEMDAINNPEDESMGTRKVAFSKEIYIERDDFREDPPKKFFRLAPGREVRLRYAYYVTCTGVVKNEQGEITELRCTYDPATKGGWSSDGRKVQATIHWVSAKHALSAEMRLYDRLFNEPDPTAAEDFRACLNPESLTVLNDAKIEPFVANAPAGSRYQFERQGYFCVDQDSTADKLVFNRTVSLKDSWAKIEQAEQKKK